MFLTFFVTIRPLTQFSREIRATNMQKSAKICLGNYFPDPFTEVQIFYWIPLKFGLQRLSRKIE